MGSRRALTLVVGLAALVVAASAHAVEPEPGRDASEGPADDGDARPAGVVLRLKTVAPKASPWGELLNNVATKTRKQTGGKVTVRVFWAQKSEASLVRQCQSGKTDGIAVSVGALAAVVPELEALELPYLFADYDDADRGMAAAAPLVAELLRQKGFVYALRGENGFRHFASKRGVIASPDDLRDVVMRSQPSALHEAMWKALGAKPKRVQVADVPDGLAGDTIEGYDNTLLFGRLAGWSEHVKAVTLSAHMYQGALVVWCHPFFDGLTPEQQALLTKPDPKLEESGMKLVRVFNDKLMPEQYAAKGITLRALSADERAAFVARLAGVGAAFEAATTPAGKQLLAAVRKAVARHR